MKIVTFLAGQSLLVQETLKMKSIPAYLGLFIIALKNCFLFKLEKYMNGKLPKYKYIGTVCILGQWALSTNRLKFYSGQN